MQDFIFIIPEGWRQFPVGSVDLISQGVSAVQTWSETNNMYDLTSAMREVGLLGPKEYCIESKLFNGEILVARVAIDV